MVKLVKIFTFAAICVLAAFVGSNLAAVYPVQFQKCISWNCDGTVNGCSFMENQWIDACVPSAPDTCWKFVGVNANCYGQTPYGLTCAVEYNRCDILHP